MNGDSDLRDSATFFNDVAAALREDDYRGRIFKVDHFRNLKRQ